MLQDNPQLPVQSGPMIGHVSMRSAQLWIQTAFEAEVAAQYKERGATDGVQSESAVTKEKSANTAHIALGSLEPGTTYEVQCLVNGEIAGEPIRRDNTGVVGLSHGPSRVFFCDWKLCIHQ